MMVPDGEDGEIEASPKAVKGAGHRRRMVLLPRPRRKVSSAAEKLVQSGSMANIKKGRHSPAAENAMRQHQLWETETATTALSSSLDHLASIRSLDLRAEMQRQPTPRQVRQRLTHPNSRLDTPRQHPTVRRNGISCEYDIDVPPSFSHRAHRHRRKTAMAHYDSDSDDDDVDITFVERKGNHSGLPRFPGMSRVNIVPEASLSAEASSSENGEFRKQQWRQSKVESFDLKDDDEIELAQEALKSFRSLNQRKMNDEGEDEIANAAPSFMADFPDVKNATLLEAKTKFVRAKAKVGMLVKMSLLPELEGDARDLGIAMDDFLVGLTNELDDIDRSPLVLMDLFQWPLAFFQPSLEVVSTDDGKVSSDDTYSKDGQYCHTKSTAPTDIDEDISSDDEASISFVGADDSTELKTGQASSILLGIPLGDINIRDLVEHRRSRRQLPAHIPPTDVATEENDEGSTSSYDEGSTSSLLDYIGNPVNVDSCQGLQVGLNFDDEISEGSGGGQVPDRDKDKNNIIGLIGAPAACGDDEHDLEEKNYFVKELSTGKALNSDERSFASLGDDSFASSSNGDKCTVQSEPEHRPSVAACISVKHDDSSDIYIPSSWGGRNTTVHKRIQFRRAMRKNALVRTMRKGVKRVVRGKAKKAAAEDFAQLDVV